MFRLSTSPLDPARLTAELRNPRAGALASFEGWVRDHHDGRPVEGLEYEAFDDMARRVGSEIVREAIERFSLIDALAVHRVGPATVGERAIWVGATAEHRQEAFLACRWIMDRIKVDLPMWKKESYVDGAPAEWVHAGASTCSCAHDPGLDPYYARQVNLDELGPEGQRRLAASRVLVVGAGGLGCPALQYLAAAGVGTLRICDGDRVDLGNLHRQILFAASDVGRNKAHVAADRLRAANPNIAVHAIGEAATEENLPELVGSVDAVLDCTDSFEAKYLIHDACWQAGTPVVQAAIHRLEGQVQVIDPHAGAGCFRCLWPEPPPPACVGSCEQAGVIGVTAGMLGVYQAVETLKLLLGWPQVLREATLLVDVLSGRTQRVVRQARTDCVCQSDRPWPGVARQLLFPGPRAAAILRQATLIDLRESPRPRLDWPGELLHFPKERWDRLLDEVADRPLVLGCANGLRTRELLQRMGHPPDVFAWTRPIEEAARQL
jgi:adenylyltransferase/sulfurtransferase